MKSINRITGNIPINGDIFNYHQYMDWMNFLVEEGNASDVKLSKKIIADTYLNLKRMERLNKTVVLEKQLIERLAILDKFQIWNIISETWCGDCAQILPVVAKIAEQSGGAIEIRLFSRDANPHWIEKYHTNGSRSIPKIVAFNVMGEELFTWGPRPQPAQDLLNDWKLNPFGRSRDDFDLELHTWYTKDKTITIQKEFYDIISGNPKIVSGEMPSVIYNN